LPTNNKYEVRYAVIITFLKKNKKQIKLKFFVEVSQVNHFKLIT